MADTCIVCLGDLGGGAIEPNLAVVDSPRPVSGDGGTGGDPPQSLEEATQIIAHLIPCGHNLHNDCLAPWVERANSCPICRQKFNVVELAETLGGTTISSYCVEDRVQVAEIDPSLLVEDLIDDSDSQPCPICGDDDNEDLLLICDGCETASHTYCVGLDSVPPGPWFCCHCEPQQPLSAEPRRNRRSRRTRGDVRRDRTRNQVQAFHWARVWQSVWDHLNLDLDFPFDDEDAADRIIQQRRREAANRRELRSWEHRFRVTGRQGGLSRFQNTSSELLDIGRGWPSRPLQRVETPEPESVDEIRAWNAFERARDIEDAQPPNRRKRKSPTASPVDPEEAQPERPLKRPRTRRPEALAEALERGESSRTAAPTTANGSADNLPISEPTFLQSLLKEVEDSTTPRRTNGTHGGIILPSRSPNSSSRQLSPAQSPLSSSPSSPGPSTDATPAFTNGPSTPASSSPEPGISSPEFSPSGSPAEGPVSSNHARLPRQLYRQPVGHHSGSSSPSRARSNESSPTRPELSLLVKSDLQKIVRTALKPHYQKRLISKDEYTDINRKVSRMLYDLAGAVDALEPRIKAAWARIANTEVDKAIAALREKKAHDAGDSSGAGSS